MRTTMPWKMWHGPRGAGAGLAGGVGRARLRDGRDAGAGRRRHRPQRGLPHRLPAPGGAGRGRADCCILVDDTTRPTPAGRILPRVLEHLTAAGIPQRKITFITANATHRAQTRADLLASSGPAICDEFVVMRHDPYQDLEDVDVVDDVDPASPRLRRAGRGREDRSQRPLHGRRPEAGRHRRHAALHVRIQRRGEDRDAGRVRDGDHRGDARAHRRGAAGAGGRHRGQPHAGRHGGLRGAGGAGVGGQRRLQRERGAVRAVLRRAGPGARGGRGARRGASSRSRRPRQRRGRLQRLPEGHRVHPDDGGAEHLGGPPRPARAPCGRAAASWWSAPAPRASARTG